MPEFDGRGDISISVVWSPFAAIYFIPIEDWIGRLYCLLICSFAIRVPKPHTRHRRTFRCKRTVVNLSAHSQHGYHCVIFPIFNTSLYVHKPTGYSLSRLVLHNLQIKSAPKTYQVLPPGPRYRKPFNPTTGMFKDSCPYARIASRASRILYHGYCISCL